MKKIMFNEIYGLTKAVLEGRKTMTRRIITDHKPDLLKLWHVDKDKNVYLQAPNEQVYRSVPKYKVYEVVAVAQAYKDIEPASKLSMMTYFELKESVGFGNKMFVRAELMPHKIRITNIRAERLQDISDEDCLREGIIKTDNGYAFRHPNRVGGFERFSNPRRAFASLINCVSGNGVWQKNPWVFVYEFELVK